MKILILTLIGLSLFSLSTYAADDCLRYFSNADRAQIVMKKDCSLILKDTSKKSVQSVRACFTKIEKQFTGKTSYGLVADLIHSDSRNSKGVIIVNTIKGQEDGEKISIELLTGSPELMKLIQNELVYNKLNDTLTIKQKTRSYFTGWKKKYDLELQCK